VFPAKEELPMSPFFSPSHKKVIFFDMNNTLVDRRQCFESSFTEVVDEFMARWDPDDIPWTAQDALQSYKLTWSDQRKAASRHALKIGELRQNCLQKALQPYPILVTPAFVSAFFSRVEELEDNYVSLFPDVEQTLDALSKRYKLAIISNGESTRLRNNVTKLKLDTWIKKEQLFTSQQDGTRKPHANMFELALHGMKTSPSLSVMVGNSWKNDIIGSTRCGIDAVWLQPSHIKKVSQRKLGKQKVITIRSFKQLLQIF
jgi:FMN phosphatase YigB (HAD superfamily)